MPDYDNIALLSLSHRRLDFFFTPLADKPLCDCPLFSLIFRLFALLYHIWGFPLPFCEEKNMKPGVGEA